MWMQLFTIVFAIALGSGLGAMVLEARGETKRLRNLRHR